MGGVTLLAATDYARCFADLFDGQRAPVFGHLALARAALGGGHGGRLAKRAWHRLGRTGPARSMGTGKKRLGAAGGCPGAVRTRRPGDAERKQAELDAANKRLDRWCAVAGPFGWEVLGRSSGKLRVVSKERDAKDDPAFSTCRPWPGPRGP
jgi:hypothetical protein